MVAGKFSAGGLLERYGVTADHTGSHPASGSPLPWYHEWSPEQRQKFAGLIDEMYELFVSRVRHSRCNERTASCSTSLLALGVSPPVLPARLSAAGLTPGVFAAFRPPPRGTWSGTRCTRWRKAGFDEGILSLCRPISLLYRESL